MESKDFIIKDGVLTEYRGKGGAVVIPEGVLAIGRYTFWNCIALTSIEMPSSVTAIGIGAFGGCVGLTSIHFSSSVTSIGEGALRGCTGLTSITYMGTMAEWLAIGKHYDWDDCAGEYVVHCTDGDIGDANALYTYTGTGGDVVIPNGVTEIGEWAFADSTDLTSVQLPSSVIFIGEGAFNGFGLTSITYTGTMAEWRDIDKDDDWDLGTGDYVIHCTDGDIAKDE